MNIELLNTIGALQVTGLILFEVFIFTTRRESIARLRALASSERAHSPSIAMSRLPEVAPRALAVSRRAEAAPHSRAA